MVASQQGLPSLNKKTPDPGDTGGWEEQKKVGMGGWVGVGSPEKGSDGPRGQALCVGTKWICAE